MQMLSVGCPGQDFVFNKLSNAIEYKMSYGLKWRLLGLQQIVVR